jgi:tetratricopeptide (TPR) repeat protein
MYQKALEINEAMGNKDGMARNYGNLGNVYSDRGELNQAEAMYRRALTLFKATGAEREIAQVRGALEHLKRDYR